MTDSLAKKDFNLLLTFNAIWEERNLSRAASKLFIGQSAVSHSLNRLRDEFDDPLFVRHPRGVTPTEFSVELAPKVSALLLQLQELYETNKKLDLKETMRKLVVASGDYFSMTYLESFISHIEATAPKVRVICQPVAHVFTPSKFETGEVHLGITAVDLEPREGFHRQVIGKDKMAVCAHKTNPLVKKAPSLKSYLNAKHIVVSNFGKEFGVVDIQLGKQNHSRSVQTVVSSFFDAGRLMRKTQLTLTAPRKICESLASEYDLKVWDLPIKTEVRPLTMVWHERTHNDPFHVWARSLIKDLQ